MMTNNCGCGVDFIVADEAPVTLEAEDSAGIALEAEDAGTAVDLEAGGDDPAGLEISADGQEEPAELEMGDAVIVAGVYPVYEGPTTVVSRIGAEMVLETALTSVMSDITVERIPVWEVSNPAGGLTVTIGRNE